MLDYVKRVCIALALAVFLGVLFIGTTNSFAASHVDVDVPNELQKSLIWPTYGEVTDTFGTREGQHFGIDIAAPEGTPVVTIADGVVSKSYYSDTYGHVVFVQHDNGLETVYAHLHQRNADEGQAVNEGELIGTVGNTGRSSGNHLHFEVHNGNWNTEKSQSIDPFFVLSLEQEAIYAAAEEVPDFEDDNVVYVLSNQLAEEQSTEDKHVGGQGIITVKAGDTLSDIAIRFHVSIEELISWNQLEGETIYPGDTLIFEVDSNGDSRTHLVKSGDTLSGISAEYKVSVESIISNNKLESDVIFPGTVLKID